MLVYGVHTIRTLTVNNVDNRINDGIFFCAEQCCLHINLIDSIMHVLFTA